MHVREVGGAGGELDGLGRLGISEAWKIMLLVMFSQASVRCSPMKAS